VNEFWVCGHCKSLNRAGAGRCYHCKEKFGTQPKDVDTVNRNAPPPAPPPRYEPPGPNTLLGVPRHDPSLPPPVSTPPGASFSETYARTGYSGSAAAAPAKRHLLGLPNLTGPIRRRAGWALAMRQTVSVGWLGYLTAGLLTLLLLVGVLVVGTLAPVAQNALQTGSITTAWGQLDAGHQFTVQALSIAFGAIGLLCLLCLSIFVGLSTHNATGLGAEMPLLTPYRAGVCWLGVLWAQTRIALGLVVPAVLLWLGYTLPGLIAALVAVELAQRRLDDPFGWLTRPYRHLPDLYHKLGTSGRDRSPIVSLWSGCFRAANLTAMVVSALPLAAVLITTGSTLAQRPTPQLWQDSGYGPAQTAIAVLVVTLVAWTAGTIGLLVPITIEIVERQRTRLALVRAGRARPWATRSPVIESPRGTESPHSPGAVYDPYARTYEEPEDQASLYSPSTTSSPPWSDDSSGGRSFD
jgi:hypothetical protein